MPHSGGRVVWFRLRPIGWMLWVALLCVGVGVAIHVLFIGAGSTVSYEIRNRAYLGMGIFFITAGILVIGSTARFWFPHLWPKTK